MKTDTTLVLMLGCLVCLSLFLIKVNLGMIDFTADMAYHMQTLQTETNTLKEQLDEQ